jgi:fumarate hydratase class II
VATALNGAIGYDRASIIVKKATASGRSLREVALEEGVDAKLYDETIDLRRIARGNRVPPPEGDAYKRRARARR